MEKISREQRIIEAAGGEYLGVQDHLAWYNEPATHTTMCADTRTLTDATDAVATEYLRILMRRKRQEFEKAAEIDSRLRGNDAVAAGRDSSPATAGSE